MLCRNPILYVCFMVTCLKDTIYQKRHHILSQSWSEFNTLHGYMDLIYTIANVHIDHKVQLTMKMLDLMVHYESAPHE